MRWLSQRGVWPKRELLMHKIDDYRVERWSVWAGEMRDKLPDIIWGKDFQDTLSRFIPVDVQARTLARDGFLDHLILSTGELIQTAQALIERADGGPGDGFAIN